MPGGSREPPVCVTSTLVVGAACGGARFCDCAGAPVGAACGAAWAKAGAERSKQSDRRIAGATTAAWGPILISKTSSSRACGSAAREPHYERRSVPGVREKLTKPWPNLGASTLSACITKERQQTFSYIGRYTSWFPGERDDAGLDESARQEFIALVNHLI